MKCVSAVPVHDMWQTRCVFLYIFWRRYVRQAIQEFALKWLLSFSLLFFSFYFISVRCQFLVWLLNLSNSHKYFTIENVADKNALRLFACFAVKSSNTAWIFVMRNVQCACTQNANVLKYSPIFHEQ